MIGRRALAPFLALAFPSAGARAQLFNPGAPTLAARDGLITPSSPAWSPLDLGASLLAWWDAERSDLITQSGGLVSSWKDIVAGYDATATTTARPTYGATSFNGRPGITFDGVANALTLLSPLGWLPVGSAGSEDWYVFDQTVLPADATTRALGSWGSGSNNNSRVTSRFVSGGINRALLQVGTGAAAPSHTNTLADFSGRTVVRSVVTPTQAFVEVGGVADTPTAVVAATAAGRLRMAANAVGTAGAFGQGIMNARIITGPLTTQQANDLRAWLTARL